MSEKPKKSKSARLKLKKTTVKDLKLRDKTAERLRGGHDDRQINTLTGT
jgi:hypothetical protein